MGEDQRQFNLPEAMTITWLLNPHPQAGSSELANTVKNLEWFHDTPNV